MGAPRHLYLSHDKERLAPGQGQLIYSVPEGSYVLFQVGKHHALGGGHRAGVHSVESLVRMNLDRSIVFRAVVFLRVFA